MILKTNIPVKEFFELQEGILDEHWEEVAGNKQAIKLAPDVDKYQLLQDIGILKNFVLFNEEEMVGYAVIVAQPHLHYKDDVFAFVDVIFVKEKYRNSRAGLLLINTLEDWAKENASILTYHTKPKHPTIEKILEKKGYSHMENIYGKLFKRAV
jgi:GNAT superfamily N-acetyltransferase